MSEKMQPKGPEQARIHPLSSEVKEGRVGIKETVEVINFVERATLALAEGMKDGIQVTDLLQVIGRYHRELMEAIKDSGQVLQEIEDLGPAERTYLVGRLLDMVAAVLASFFPKEEVRISVIADAIKNIILALQAPSSDG